MTLSPEQYYGRARDYGLETTVNLALDRRVIRAAPATAADYVLPRPGGRSNIGGPYFIIINRGVGEITVKLGNGNTVGTIAGSKTSMVFLTGRTNNQGYGQWRVLGAGNIFIGDQGSGGELEFDFDYGTAGAPTGLSMDLGSAASTVPQEHGFNIDFGTAFSFSEHRGEF